MSLIVCISGSPSSPSRSRALADLVGRRLGGGGFEVRGIDVRDLPAGSLIQGRCDDPAIVEALELIERAEGVVVVTPVYKAAYSGVLKAFLDLLPQFGLAGKVALPLATGGTLAHVLAIDYALRPLLAALNAQQIVSGLFLLDKQLERQPDGSLLVEPQLESRLQVVVDDFITAVRRARASVASAPALLSQQQPSSQGVAATAAVAGGRELASATPRLRSDGTPPAV